MSNYLLSSRIINAKAGIPRVINAKAFIAGWNVAKTVANNVGMVTKSENLLRLFLATVGKYLRGKNIQKPAI